MLIEYVEYVNALLDYTGDFLTVKPVYCTCNDIGSNHLGSRKY